MQLSMINLWAVSLTLVCSIHPLHSEPRTYYLSNYNPSVPTSHAQYNPSSIQSPSLRYESLSQSVHPANNYQIAPVGLSLSERISKRNPDGYRNYNFASSNYETGTEKHPLNFEENVNGSHEDEIIEKMIILDKLLSEDSSEKELGLNGIEDRIIPEESRRVVRQVRNEKPGFFWTLARVTFEMFNDTKSAIKQISNIINNTIAPDSATQSTMMTAQLTAAASTDEQKNATNVNATETTTTPAPYVLTRSGLQTLIRRNVLGLVRLFNIEWKDALDQSEMNVKEFQKDLGNQIAMNLRDNPDAY
ncbi:uncharacterized protein LOC108627443 [Ceratina calcarata]|uniref:Uncharacterized protein LOC108627443 n=1 Tax=Ceratina calcarata TaxID=156304 RepID=A0AAJ7S621_9HYME|nr:uncharacterized protein LOC108627443 [Ceratina calcarata]